MTPITVSFHAPIFGSALKPGYPGIVSLKYRLSGWELNVIAMSKMNDSPARGPWWRAAGASSRALEYLIFDYETLIYEEVDVDG